MDASQYVHVVEARQGHKIGCVEEIAWRNGLARRRQPRARSPTRSVKSGYGDYLQGLLDEGRDRLMEIRPLPIEGAFVVTPRQFRDDRGVFLESFRGDRLAERRRAPPRTSCRPTSRSRPGARVRGIHFADVPAGQAKYVTALAGLPPRLVVDLRVGSPTFGQWDSVLLDTVDRRAVYLAEGLGHAFCALEDGTTAMLPLLRGLRPDAEHGIHPLDPGLGLDCPPARPRCSPPRTPRRPASSEAPPRAGSRPGRPAAIAPRRSLSARTEPPSGPASAPRRRAGRPSGRRPADRDRGSSTRVTADGQAATAASTSGSARQRPRTSLAPTSARRSGQS